MQLTIHKQVKSTRVPRAELQRLFELTMRRLGRKSWKADVNLVFAGDTKLRRLNREYRGQDRPTDVLSFNLDDPREAGSVFGEIYISVATARRQAARYRCSLSREMLRLTAHGLLHLLGYDHKSQTDKERMLALQEELLESLRKDRR